jgi:hypothetical protein
MCDTREALRELHGLTPEGIAALVRAELGRAQAAAAPRGGRRAPPASRD